MYRRKTLNLQWQYSNFTIIGNYEANFGAMLQSIIGNSTSEILPWHRFRMMMMMCVCIIAYVP